MEPGPTHISQTEVVYNKGWASVKSDERLWLAFFWITSGALGFSFMSAFVKLLKDSIPQTELMLFRSLITLVVLLPWAVRNPAQLWPKQNKRWLLVRGCFGLMALMGFFYGVQHLPLAVASFVSGIAPVFVLLVSWVLLGERVSPQLLGWIGIALLGVAMVAKPWDSLAGLNQLALGITVAGSFCSACAYVTIRRVSGKVHPNTIILYFMWVSGAASLVLALPHWVTPPDIQVWLKILGVGLGATLGQYGLTRAYGHARATLVSAMGTSSAVFGALVGITVFNEVLGLDQVLGCFFIVAAVVLIQLKRA